MKVYTRHLTGLQMFQLLVIIAGHADIHDVISQFNMKHKTELNIFLNLNQREVRRLFAEAVCELNHLPKLISTDLRHIAPLQQMFSEQSLTVAWMTWQQLNETIVAIDRLLWQLHFKDIILVYQQSQLLQKELDIIFQICWKHGFTSVLVWLDPQTFYTYHPYPSIRIKRLTNISEFGDKSHLENFHLYNWPQPAIHFPPRFGVSTDRHGHQIYWGYLQKIISTFLTFHNGTIRYYFIDMWANASSDQLLEYIAQQGYNFVPLMGFHIPQLAASCPLHLAKGVLMVPNAQEISESLYLSIAFDMLTWWAILFLGFMFFLLVLVIGFKETKLFYVGKAALTAFGIIMFVAVPTRSRNFLLHVLFLFTGFFLTNYYSTSLSSLYTSKVYGPQLEFLLDIKRTSFRIFEHTLELVNYERFETLPPYIRQRFHAGNNTEFFISRQSLNMTYIYVGLEDIIDYYMLQQIYLKKPIVKKLNEELFYRPHFVRMAHRSPLLEQFNRHLSYVMDTGLYRKFVVDANWQGVHSGNLKILRNSEENIALKLAFFRNAFVILIIGLFGALVTFVMESIWGRVETLQS